MPIPIPNDPAFAGLPLGAQVLAPLLTQMLMGDPNAVEDEMAELEEGDGA